MPVPNPLHLAHCMTFIGLQVAHYGDGEITEDELITIRKDLKQIFPEVKPSDLDRWAQEAFE